ncbi:MAG TPA: AbrB/MazE/SpoVT family DNA-binding domain-containing protein [Kiritimatiellia bacterium]|jgi:AbrB family looped-hinge helix DNA binding protein
MISDASNHARVSSKGQIVIPANLRKKFHIEEGTRVIVEERTDGILLRPVTHDSIDRLFGILKRPPGSKSFAEEWAEHKREEREIEEKKNARHGLG